MVQLNVFLSIIGGFLVATVTSSNISLLDLDKIANYLRNGDMSLVRTSTTPEDKLRQNDGGCSRLSDVLEVLTNTNARTADRSKAANIATLCSVDHPENRAFIGGIEGVPAAVVDILSMPGREEKETETAAAASAAELVWILSYNNLFNHRALVNAGVIEALGEIIMSCGEGEECFRTKMWSAAGLQNLAASYCNTESGRCLWKWDYRIGTLKLQKESPLYVDGSDARERIIQIHNLVAEIISIACHNGPVDKKPKPDQIWPSNARIDEDEDKDSIITWAVTGVLKNLALSSKGRYEIAPAEMCLCLLSDSPDWIENIKGAAALHNTGRMDNCFPPEPENDLPMCLDKEWVNTYGDDCAHYEPHHCAKYGNESDAEGIHANQACCVCGGGDKYRVVYEEEEF